MLKFVISKLTCIGKSCQSFLALQGHMLFLFPSVNAHNYQELPKGACWLEFQRIGSAFEWFQWIELLIISSQGQIKRSWV